MPANSKNASSDAQQSGSVGRQQRFDRSSAMWISQACPYDPWPLDREPKWHGRTYMAWPMYNIDDPVRGIEAFCRVLEQMSPAALEHWYSLPDRVLSISAGDREMDFSDLDATGFLLPPALIRRVRHLRLRIQVTLCPKAAVRLLSRY
jgi:hypothetical protein